MNVYKRNDLRRPSQSATQPKLAYPGNIPTRFSTTSSVVVPMTPKPRPPCSTGKDRYGGIHVNSPHQANMPKKFMNSSARVGFKYGGLKRPANPVCGVVTAR